MLLTGLVLWWWWPEPAPQRVVRIDEVTEAPEQLREVVAVEQQPAKRGPANPPDPVGTGPCSLELALYDAWTGAAIRGTVRLYRLDAPANEHWNRGDQLQAVVDVAVEGTVVGGLPAGRYRAHCVTQRYPGTDHAEFEVAGELSRCALSVETPRAHDAWLIVRDERGMAIEAGTLRGDLQNFSGRRLDPAWFNKRTLKVPSDTILLGGGWGGGRGGMRMRKARAVDGRYLLGRYREDAWEKSTRVGWTWKAEGRTSVHVKIVLERWRETTFVGVSVPLEWVERSVLMPDGGLASDAGAELRTWCPAVSDDSKTVVKVRVRLNGYEDLEFEFEPHDAVPVRTLEPKRAEPPSDR
ncbi:MAG: hypothetical protein ACYTHK_10240 [Planctomycetota bacterium]